MGNYKKLHVESVKMTKKDYEALAGAIRRAKNQVSDSSPNKEAMIRRGILLVQHTIADVLEADNKLFQPNKFNEACKV
jgi:hypothetical protein